MRKLVVTGCTFMLGCGLALANDVVFTGCLTPGGEIVSVAIGSAPLRPCMGLQTQISWNAQGPQGPSGADGADGVDGADGTQGPPGAAGAAEPRYEYVGMTEHSFTGGAGVFTFNANCHLDFGDGARMCTSEEVMNTTDPPIISEWGWVRPTFVPLAVTDDAHFDVYHADISGMVFGETLACYGWSQDRADIYGLALVGYSGAIKLQACGAIDMRVACCAPVEADD